MFRRLRRTDAMVAAARREWRKFMKSEIKAYIGDTWTSEENGLMARVDIEYNGYWFYEYTLMKQGGKWKLYGEDYDTYNDFDQDEQIEGFELKDIYDIMREDDKTLAKCLKEAKKCSKEFLQRVEEK